MAKDSPKCACCGVDLAADAHNQAPLATAAEVGTNPDGTEPHQRRHPTVRVTVGELSADIDIGIAPLIRLLWECGIDTIMSCEDDGFGYVWVQFLSVDDLTAFLNLVGRYEPGKDALYNRMHHHWYNPDHHRDWVYEIHPFDFAFDLDVEDPDNPETHDGECEFGFFASVRVPPEDLPVVTSRLSEHATSIRRT